MITAQQVFNAAAATATVRLDNAFHRCPTKIIEVITTGFTGTIDFKGVVAPAQVADNLGYLTLGAASAVRAVTQLSYTTDTSRYRYLLTEPFPYVDVVMTRSAGSVTVNAYGYELILPGTGIFASGDVNSLASAAGIQDVLAVARYNATLPTITDTRFNALQVGSRGSLHVELFGANSANSAAINQAADTDAAYIGLATTARVQNYNGTNYDRARNNYEETVLASAARTASVDSADMVNYNGRGLVLVIDVTAIVADPSLVFTIQGKSSLGSDYYAILASAAIVGTGVTTLTVYPGVTVAANVAASQPLPRIWRVSIAAADSDSITYSVSANYCS